MDLLQLYPTRPPPPQSLYISSYLWVSCFSSSQKIQIIWNNTSHKASCVTFLLTSVSCSDRLSGGCWWPAAVEELQAEEHQHDSLRQPCLSENHWGPSAHLEEPQPRRLLLPKSESKRIPLKSFPITSHISLHVQATVCVLSDILFICCPIRDKLWAWMKRQTIQPSQKTEKCQAEWREDSSMISYLGRPFVFLPHTAQRYVRQSQYQTSLNHYILTDDRALYGRKNRVKLSGCKFFSHQVNSWKSILRQIKPNHQMVDYSIWHFFTRFPAAMLMVQLENCVMAKPT